MYAYKLLVGCDICITIAFFCTSLRNDFLCEVEKAILVTFMIIWVMAIVDYEDYFLKKNASVTKEIHIWTIEWLENHLKYI